MHPIRVYFAVGESGKSRVNVLPSSKTPGKVMLGLKERDDEMQESVVVLTLCPLVPEMNLFGISSKLLYCEY